MTRRKIHFVTDLPTLYYRLSLTYARLRQTSSVRSTTPTIQMRSDSKYSTGSCITAVERHALSSTRQVNRVLPQATQTSLTPSELSKDEAKALEAVSRYPNKDLDLVFDNV